jgi:polyisoprenoid-binding protein YceI
MTTVTIRRIANGLVLVLLSGGCRGDAPDASARSGAATERAATSVAPASGPRTFAIVPEQSTASYHANEEFFPGAMKLLGIEAGKVPVVGRTQAIEGQFQLDPDRPTALVGDNSFSVRVNTLTSNQTKRDDYIREIRDDGGPSFDAYPLATFKATAIDGNAATSADGRELNLALTGDLTVRDVTRPVTFAVKARLLGDTLTGVGTTRVLLSTYGIGPIAFSDILAVADEIGIEVRFTARVK